jgi:acyl carrier protein
MTPQEIRQAVLESIESVAPEVDASALDPDDNLRDVLDIDSMDFLNFVDAVHRKLHVEVPEADYPKLETIGGCVLYVAAKLGAGG